ncbi:MAG: hypothetical protein KGR26_05365 [Cyanobacteria bacterium REEB65]|nr:hypothetical protein [Cyanobacteria bacterium REEB65]
MPARSEGSAAALGVALCTLLLPSCGMGGAAPRTPPAPAPTATPSQSGAPVLRHVAIVDFGYVQATVSLPVGGTIDWTNTGVHQHTATLDDPNGWGSPLLGKGQSWEQTFATPGVFPYHCETHPWMKGTIVVTAP